MKRIIFFLSLVLVGQETNAQNIPEVPSKVEFANVRVALNPNARQKISSEVKSLLTPDNSYLHQKLERMQLYFPIIEKILEEENIPDDFKYLAVLESALNPEAVSVTKAVGFWQFKDFTAAEMGLIMSRHQDDRKNITLSTQAAAKYLKKNNLIFKNWLSTTLSYNIGAGAAAQYIPVEWSFANEVTLDNSANDYLIKALANKIAYSYKLATYTPSTNKLIEYPGRGKYLSDIAEETNTSETEIRRYNSWLKSDVVPTDKEYVIILPTNKVEADILTSKINNLASTNYVALGYPKLKRETMVVTSLDQPVFYEINNKKGILAQPGDAVASLARKAKMKITKFLKFNDMSDRDLIKEGSVYYLQKKYKKGEVPYHTILKDQTLWDVSQMYGIRLKNLIKYNRVNNSETILPNRILWLQKKRPRKQEIQYNTSLIPPTEIFAPETIGDNSLEVAVVEKEKNNVNPATHRVLENETLFSLANKYGTTVDELRRLNNLKPNDGIQYNQRLIIPASNDEPEDNWVESVEEVSKKAPVLMPEKPRREPVTTSKTEINNTKNESSVYYVQSGETLFGIARKYDTTVDELRRLNNMSASETLKSGQKLYVSGSASFNLTNTDSQTNNNRTVQHTVSKGETLFSISNRYGTTVENIQTLNGLSGNNIMIGQRLTISGNNTFTTPQNKVEYHVVRPGETLFSISRKYNTTVENLRFLNNISGNRLLSGDKIIVRK